jgi:hypothetical protein
MLKWLTAVGTLLAAVLLLLLRLGDSPSEGAPHGRPAADDSPGRGVVAPAVADAPTPEAEPPSQPAAEPSPAPGSTPDDLERDRVLDRDYPRRFAQAAATRCDVTGFDPDAKARIEYRLKIVGGEVLATGVRVTDSTLGDAVLEHCIVAAIEQTRWRDDTMPDLDEERELVFRVRAQKKFLSPQEQEAFGKQTGEERDVAEPASAAEPD